MFKAFAQHRGRDGQANHGGRVPSNSDPPTLWTCHAPDLSAQEPIQPNKSVSESNWSCGYLSRKLAKPVQQEAGRDEAAFGWADRDLRWILRSPGTVTQ